MNALAVSAKVAFHLPTQAGWKAELAKAPQQLENSLSWTERYMMDITVVSCFNYHATLGNWSARAKHRTRDL